jgi:hypothetical protein
MEEGTMSEAKVWTTKVVEENGDTILLFPPDFLNHVGWKEGDNLAWVISDDGMSCYIRKLQSPED